MHRLWPMAPVSMAIIPEVESTSPFAMKVGRDPRPDPCPGGCASCRSSAAGHRRRSRTRRPTSSRFSSVISKPASASACFAAETPYHMADSLRRTALGSIQRDGSKPCTSPDALLGVGRRIELGHHAQAGDAVEQVPPGGVLVVADGADDAESGDDDAAGVIGLAHGVPLEGLRWRAVRRGRTPGRRPTAVSAKGMARRSAAALSSSARGNASGAIRLMRPVRTWPGPTSMKVVTRRPSSRWTAPTQSTPVVRWSTSSARQPSAVVIDAGVGVGEQRRARVAERDAGEDPAHAVGGLRHERGVGGDGDRQLDGAPGAERLRDRECRPRRRPARRDTTTWPGELRLATPKTPCSDAWRTSSGSAASSRPMIAAIRPSRPLPDACICWPADADQAHGVGEIEGAGGDQGAVLAHGVAGGEGRAPGCRRPSSYQRSRTASR